MSYNNIDLAYIIPIFFNQKDTATLTRLLRTYASYSPELTRRIMFIIVDDHSPIDIKIPDDINLNYRLYRVDSDIMWNQAGARNLGATMSPAPRLILTDVDHVFPEQLLTDICNSPVPLKNIYKFKRNNSDGTKRSTHANTFYLSKGTFTNALGYDEEFCGHYGYEDVLFQEFVKRIGFKLKYFTRRQRIISTAVDRNDSYHNLVRDTSRNEKLLASKRQQLISRNPYSCHSRLMLNFDWHLATENLING